MKVVSRPFKDVSQLILCATWPRRRSGYNNSVPIPHIKAGITRWPARPSCAHNQLRHLLNEGVVRSLCIFRKLSLLRGFCRD